MKMKFIIFILYFEFSQQNTLTNTEIKDNFENIQILYILGNMHPFIRTFGSKLKVRTSTSGNTAVNCLSMEFSTNLLQKSNQKETELKVN